MIVGTGRRYQKEQSLRAPFAAALIAAALAFPASAIVAPREQAAQAIVVPFTDTPFASMIEPDARVTFDFTGAGDRRAQAWLNANAAWLVWDPNWRGDIRSGADLIGARSWQTTWRNGFQALAALDANNDGEISGVELGGLALWRDTNGDGVSDPGEVLPVAAHGITALATRGARTRPGLSTAPQGVRFDDGATRPLYDWTPALEPETPAS